MGPHPRVALVATLVFEQRRGLHLDDSPGLRSRIGETDEPADAGAGRQHGSVGANHLSKEVPAPGRKRVADRRVGDQSHDVGGAGLGGARDRSLHPDSRLLRQEEDSHTQHDGDDGDRDDRGTEPDRGRDPAKSRDFSHQAPSTDNRRPARSRGGACRTGCQFSFGGNGRRPPRC